VGDADAPVSLTRGLWDQVWPLAIAVLIALGIRSVVIESYYVPSESMLPTLLIGDHVFVNKFVFGARIPLTDIHLPSLREPTRGEIVVFALGRRKNGQICPLDQCPDAHAEGFVKRIVALPGDRVGYQNGTLYINGDPVSAIESGETFTDESQREYQVKREDLLGCSHDVLDLPRYAGLSDAEFKVPEGRYYMMGDNRDNSNDSRAWGTVRLEELKGPVILNYWSWNNQESWLAMINPLTWIRLLSEEMRWGRIGMDHRCEGI
jgi:signal peptidase I